MKARIKGTNEIVECEKFVSDDYIPGIQVKLPGGGRLTMPADCLIELTEPDWSAFRREAAKEILAGMMAHQRILYGSNYEELAKWEIAYADELIRQLKEEEK